MPAPFSPSGGDSPVFPALEPADRQAASSASAQEAADLRATQDAAALAWLAVAGVRSAPAGLWEDISRKLPQENNPRITVLRDRLRRALPLTGWAAALVIGGAWWWSGGERFSSKEPLPPHPSLITSGASPAPPGDSSASRAPLVSSNSSDSGLQKELHRLRELLARQTGDPGTPAQGDPPARVAVLELRPPGGRASDKPEKTSAGTRLQSLLAEALERNLILEAGKFPAGLVIERGWPKGPWLPPENAEVIRHLSFPAENWETLGLWRGSSGDFYDPASALLWHPAPDGLGYLGRLASAPPDPSGYQLPPIHPPVKPQAAPAPEAPAPQREPAGYLVSGPADKEATLLLADLPPPAEGTEQVLVAAASDGSTQNYTISTSLSIPFSITGAGSPAGQLTSLTLSEFNASGFISFSVIERSAEGFPAAAPTVILQGGSAAP